MEIQGNALHFTAGRGGGASVRGEGGTTSPREGDLLSGGFVGDGCSGVLPGGCSGVVLSGLFGEAGLSGDVFCGFFEMGGFSLLSCS
jgi:hypothetical protein